MSHPGHVALGFEADKLGFTGLHPRVEANLNPSCLTEPQVTPSTHRDVQARQVTGWGGQVKRQRLCERVEHPSATAARVGDSWVEMRDKGKMAGWYFRQHPHRVSTSVPPASLGAASVPGCPRPCSACAGERHREGQRQ